MPPSDKKIEAALVAEVRRLFKANDLENLTVKRVRNAVEEALELEEGWFREHDAWKDKSKEIITTETELQYKQEPSSPPKREASPKTSTKRKSPPVEDAPQSPENADSESEMSVVLDEAPRKRRKQSKEKNGDAKKPKKAASKPKKAVAEPMTDNEAKIKELQSQLVQCGIRKVWGVELKRFDSDKEKIGHLQGMLREVGMTGRFSASKAKEIKDARELAQDLEAVQEGAKAWGADSDEEGKPRRRIARGLAELDWLADDGSDSD